MRKPELVSVIVPMYNASKFIHQCLQSIAGQDWINLEAILVDDASSDNTVDLCHSFIKEDKRFSLVCAVENGGPGQARNIGMAVAKGDFILFLDADDWLNINTISTMLRSQRTSQADIVISAFDKIVLSSQTSIRVSHFSEDKVMHLSEISEYALNYMREPGRFMMFSHCWGRLFATSVIKDNDLKFVHSMRICEDVLFNFEYLHYVHTVSYSNIPTYNHRFGNPDSASMAFTLSEQNPLLFYNDIWMAYVGIFNFIKKFSDECDMLEVQRITRLGHISHSIVLLVRACGTSKNKPLLELVSKMVNNPDVIENLKYYVPLKGQSRLIPLFLRLKAVFPLILLCRYKYNKRYGKLQ